MDAFTRDIAGDGGAVRLPADLVDLVDVDNPKLCPLHVIVGILEKAENDSLDVFPDIPGFRQGGGISDGEGNVEDAGEGAGQECLAATGGADEENVALFQFHIGMVGGEGVGMFTTDPLVVVVDGHREGSFRPFLPDDMPVQFCPDFARLGQGLERAFAGRPFANFPIQNIGAKGMQLS